MGDEVHLEEPRVGIIPIRERPDGDLLAGLRGPFSLPDRPAVLRIGLRRVDGRRANREQMLTDTVKRQMAVAFHRRDQIGQDRLEAFPADAICGLPEDDEPRGWPPNRSAEPGQATRGRRDGLG